MICIAVANPATNDTDSDIRNRSDVSLNRIWLGRSYVGISCFQKATILQWVSEQAFVDHERIAVAFRLNGVEDNLKVYHYTKYIDPRSRVHDFKPLPEGISFDEYLDHANVDVQEHCLRPKRAVPQLRNDVSLSS